MLNNKIILITGGTGSFGYHFVDYVLAHYTPKKIIIYSRDEYKQYLMDEKYKTRHDDRLRFFVGDVTDESRLRRAMNGVDYVIHAAALKQLSSCEYNPIETIKTNVNGAISVINAAIDANVKKVVSLSTDKSVKPINIYGGTKMLSDKLFTAGNSYSGNRDTRFCVVRYGNVAGSRGSVIPYFQRLIAKGETELPITDYRMTRFWIDVEQGVVLVIQALKESRGGEIFISKIPSFKIADLAEAMLPGCEKRESGIRKGEKLHEVMIVREDAQWTYEYEKNYVIFPHYEWWNTDMLIPGGRLVESDFEYSSATNMEWLTVTELQRKLENIRIYE